MNTLTLHALAEPNRLRIVELLRDGPFSVGDIANQLFIRQPQVSKHLQVLHEAGIVDKQVAAQRHMYHLQSQPFEELDTWLDSFSRLWEDRLDLLNEYVKKLKEEG